MPTESRTLAYVAADGQAFCHACAVHPDLPISYSYPELAGFLPIEDKQWVIIGVQDVTPLDCPFEECAHCGESINK